MWNSIGERNETIQNAQAQIKKDIQKDSRKSA